MHFDPFDRPRSMRATGIALLAALALALTACGGGGDDPEPTPSTEATQTDTATPGETPSPTPTVEPTTLGNLDEVQVAGDLAAQPEVSAPYPFEVDETIWKTVVPGSGPAVPSATATIQVQYVGINARTGEVFDASWLNGSPAVFPLSQLIPGFAKGVDGQPVGSRMAIAITSSEGYDPSGQPSVGIEPGDTLLFIVDILDTELAGPSGEPVAPPEGLPQVSENGGVPSISIPAGLAEPTEVRVQPLIQGSGATLREELALTSHSVCVTWDGTEYHNDYDMPATTDTAASGAHVALFTALTGQQVGSRVLVTMPGSVAYPNGNRTPSIAPATPVACVVDLLFVTAA